MAILAMFSVVGLAPSRRSHWATALRATPTMLANSDCDNSAPRRACLMRLKSKLMVFPRK